jgi:hypothetical protein
MFDTDGALLTKIRQMETEIRQRHHNCAYLRLDKEFSKAYAPPTPWIRHAMLWY